MTETTIRVVVLISLEGSQDIARHPRHEREEIQGVKPFGPHCFVLCTEIRNGRHLVDVDQEPRPGEWRLASICQA